MISAEVKSDIDKSAKSITLPLTPHFMLSFQLSPRMDEDRNL